MLIAGVDEAGRGPLAGPVVAAAVILDPSDRIRGLRDSKLLSAEAREELALEIRSRALAWAVAECDVEEIDTLNILRATLLAMKRAVERLATSPHVVWIDGQHCPLLACPVRAIVDGDRNGCRDRRGFHSRQDHARRDAGRARSELIPCTDSRGTRAIRTPEHLAALREHGPCPTHRRDIRTGHADRIRFLIGCAHDEKRRRGDSCSTSSAPSSIGAGHHPRGRRASDAARRARRLGRVRRRVARWLSSGDGSGAPRRAVADPRYACIWRVWRNCWTASALDFDAQRELVASISRGTASPLARQCSSGLPRLKRRRMIGTLSNGNMALLVDSRKVRWPAVGCVLSAELFRHYKPDPEVYLGAAALLGLNRAR